LSQVLDPGVEPVPLGYKVMV